MSSKNSFVDALKGAFGGPFNAYSDDMTDNSEKIIKSVKNDKPLQTPAAPYKQEQNRYDYERIIELFKNEISITFGDKQDELNTMLQKSIKMLGEMSSEKINLTLRENRELKEKNENFKKECKYLREDLAAQTENYMKLNSVMEYYKGKNSQKVLVCIIICLSTVFIVAYLTKTDNKSKERASSAPTQQPKTLGKPSPPPALPPSAKNDATAGVKRQRATKR